MPLRILALLHPVLISMAPILLLAAANIGQIELNEIWAPTTAMVALAILVLGVWWLLIRNLPKAAILASLTMLFVLNYGHLHAGICRGFIVIPSKYVHLGLIVGWIGSLAVTYFYIFRSPRVVADVTKTLGLMSAILVIMGIVQIGRGYLAKYAMAQTVTRESVLPIEELVETSPGQLDSPDHLPDIYYIVLDAYGRHDQLAKHYGYDNREFLNYLNEKGFYVADQSHSNYACTLLSLASSLNLRYLNNEVELVGRHGRYSQYEFGTIFDLIRRNDVGLFLKKMGYSFIHFTTWSTLTAKSEIADITVPEVSVENATLVEAIAGVTLSRDLSEFNRVFIQTTIFRPILSVVHRVLMDSSSPGIAVHHLRSFQALKEIPQLEQPTFAFAHIICPHPPYCFDRDGNILDEAWPPDWYDREGFVDQLIFLNRELRSIVDTILEESDHEPIIILQADHGTCVSIDHNRPPHEQQELIQERMAILNAYYVPHSSRDKLYPSISPVNTFRVLLTSMFEAVDLPLLPDRSYFSWYPMVLDLKEFTTDSADGEVPASPDGP